MLNVKRGNIEGIDRAWVLRKRHSAETSIVFGRLATMSDRLWAARISKRAISRFALKAADSGSPASASGLSA
jgi:hypothetical protein